MKATSHITLLAQRDGRWVPLMKRRAPSPDWIAYHVVFMTLWATSLPYPVRIVVDGVTAFESKVSDHLPRGVVPT